MAARYPRVAGAIREARLRKGWSQEDAAVHIGVTRFQWIRWEQGLHMPNEEHQQLLIAMGVDPTVFGDINPDDNEGFGRRMSRYLVEIQGEIA